jgi:squalene-associated FAD-dependent desaturase
MTRPPLSDAAHTGPAGRPLAAGKVRPTALVVGAGWAGLTAAVGLTATGWQVDLLDAAPRAGGRARAVEVRFGAARVAVDNGQHLLIGAYRDTLALLARVGVDASSVLSRTPLRLRGPGGLDLRAAPLPAPLNLAWAVLRARGLSWAERRAMVSLVAALRLSGPQAVPDGATVDGWLAARRQPQSLRRRIWEPLCIGALNTPPERACARTFARVLCDALLARASDSDFLLPVATLSEVLPDPTVGWLTAHGARVRLRTPCRALEPTDRDGWIARTDDGPLAADRVVLATPPRHVGRLLGEHLDHATRARLDAFAHESIATVWLAWDAPVVLPEVTMLEEDVASGGFGQWLFRRERHAPDGPRSLAGVVVSAAGRGEVQPERLALAVARQVTAQTGCPPPDHARAIVERQATIRCDPARPRFEPHTLAKTLRGIALAGDWCWPAYPATLESAVRSGDAAARWLTTGRLTKS